MLLLAKSGKYNGYLLEGMACPGGCVGGAGVCQPINKSTMEVKKAKTAAAKAHADESEYGSILPQLEN